MHVITQNMTASAGIIDHHWIEIEVGHIQVHSQLLLEDKHRISCKFKIGGQDSDDR
jgi:hypothetical protein